MVSSARITNESNSLGLWQGVKILAAVAGALIAIGTASVGIARTVVWAGSLEWLPREEAPEREAVLLERVRTEDSRITTRIDAHEREQATRLQALEAGVGEVRSDTKAILRMMLEERGRKP